MAILFENSFPNIRRTSLPRDGHINFFEFRLCKSASSQRNPGMTIWMKLLLTGRTG